MWIHIYKIVVLKQQLKIIETRMERIFKNKDSIHLLK